MMVWILVVVLIGSTAFAEETVQTNEQQTLAQIAQNLQVAKPLAGVKVTKEETDFCTTFLEDLKVPRNIEFIAPIVKTDDYTDPRLQSYLGKCPKLTPNKRVAFEPKIWEYAKTLPEDQAEKLGRVSYTTGDFRLYHVDIDNNPANGKEYLFYGGGSTYPAAPKGTECGDYSNYRLIDFETCKLKPGRQVGDTLRCSDHSPSGNLNGIIRYRDQYYIWDAQYSKLENAYLLFLSGWHNPTDQIRRTCVLINKTSGKAGGSK